MFQQIIVFTALTFFILIGFVSDTITMFVSDTITIMQDPISRQAVSACGLYGTEHECYLRIALENKKPEVCNFAHASVNDWCTGDYFVKRNTPESCTEIQKVATGLYEPCLDYYKENQRENT